MLARYDFKRDDGAWIEVAFPIGKCPDTMTCDDGVKARRGWRPDSLPSVSWKDGQETDAYRSARDERRTKDNMAAGERGRGEWKERMPKLRLE